MQTLLRTLEDHDLGHLQILAEFWGFDLPAGSRQPSVAAIAQAMLDPQLTSEIESSLPKGARDTLDFILGQGGRVPLADLVRRFGDLREMGPGRRDREKPWRDPASPLEALWFRGIIARAFADTDTGPQEFAFVPSDLIPLLPSPALPTHSPKGHAAEPPSQHRLASSEIVDDATTMLAALRRTPNHDRHLTPERKSDLSRYLRQPDSLDLLLTLLLEASILTAPPLEPNPESARTLLEAPRAEVLRTLLRTWVQSSSWNDLQHTHHLEPASGDWPNDPLSTRLAAINFLRGIPPGSWWDLETFIAAVREDSPGFQRPAGDFDSWYLRDTSNGEFLRGYEHWDAVEGTMLRFIILQVLHWLGAIDIGHSRIDGPIDRFRLTHASTLLFDGQAPIKIRESLAHASVRVDGSIHVPRPAVRALRYQIARFTTWDLPTENTYFYRLTPSALTSAAEQGLTLTHIRTVLEAIGEKPLPAILENALNRWADHGVEARLEQETLLRVTNPEMLETLMKKKSTSRFIHEVLNPTTAVVHQNNWKSLIAAAVRHGVLIESPNPLPSDPS
jgi:hypothetical protein